MIGPYPASLRDRGRAPLGSVAPGVRFLSWLLLMSTCLVAHPVELPDIILVLAALSLWAVATGTRGRTIVRLIVLGLIFFMPFFLFLPWTGSSDVAVKLVPFIKIRSDAWITPFTILFRGICCLLLGAGLIAVFPESDLHRFLSRLPAPRIFPVIIHQIMRFLSPLAHEGINISRAVVLRGGTAGWRTGVKVARTLPVAWLPRVLARSIRVSNAMEVRGYHGQIMETQFSPWRMRDAMVLLLAASFLLLAILLKSLAR